MEEGRVLVFPLPAPGHMKPFFCLGMLLADAGVEVVFLNTEYNHNLIANNESWNIRFPTFHFETIPDGLPADKARDQHDIEFYFSLRDGTKPLLRKLLQSYKDDSRSITCIICDVVLSSPFQVAQEFGIPAIPFNVGNARNTSIPFFIPQLLQQGQIPYTDDNPLGDIHGVPLFEGLLRRKDLPGFWDAKMITDEFNPMMFINEGKEANEASSLILNTFEELEPQFLTYLSSIYKKIYTIGPVNALYNSKVGDSSNSSFLNGMFKEDETCISWLDSQEMKSVIYVSFGTSVKMKSQEFIEFWHGLVNSGRPFLCVMRNDTVDVGVGKLIKQLRDESGEEKLKNNNALIVEWAPQEKVLKHPSIGGFLTHCGWNSVIESIAAGVPMLCWPAGGDQPNNATCVERIWKIGFEIKKEDWDRFTLEKMVKDLMKEKKDIHVSMDNFSNLANYAVSKRGSSFHNLEMLIQDIKKMVPN